MTATTAAVPGAAAAAAASMNSRWLKGPGLRPPQAASNALARVMDRVTE